jgi:hypothetical protein
MRHLKKKISLSHNRNDKLEADGDGDSTKDHPTPRKEGKDTGANAASQASKKNIAVSAGGTMKQLVYGTIGRSKDVKPV